MDLDGLSANSSQLGKSSAGGDVIHFLVLPVTLYLSQCTGIFLSTFLMPIYYRPTKLAVTWAPLLIIPGHMVLLVDTNILLSSLSMLALSLRVSAGPSSWDWMDFQQILLNLVKQHRW